MAWIATFVLIALCVTSMFGQGPIQVKAGDRAPSLTWTRILASEANSAGPQTWLGNTTVLFFLPPVSHNQETVASWNKLAERFSGKPVNFVWIANENEDSLVPFLKDHPIRGWMVLDPDEDSYKAYGIESSDSVLINQEGIIAGFTSGTPQPDQIQAVMDGRAIAIEGEATEAQLDGIFEHTVVRLEATPFRWPPPPDPGFPPSNEVHISISKTDDTTNSIGRTHWMLRGYDLKSIVSMLMRTSPTRVELPAALDNETRYDVVFVPPRQENEQTMNRYVRQGIEKYFGVTIAPEIRSVDAFVMTAVEGKTPAHTAAKDGFMTMGYYMDFALPTGTERTEEALEGATRRAMYKAQARQAMATGELVGMTAHSSSIDEFRRALEDGLRRPVIDETGLAGVYDFKIEGNARTTEEFLKMVRDQLGLVLTSTQRNVEAIVVRLRE